MRKEKEEEMSELVKNEIDEIPPTVGVHAKPFYRFCSLHSNP